MCFGCQMQLCHPSREICVCGYECGRPGGGRGACNVQRADPRTAAIRATKCEAVSADINKYWFTISSPHQAHVGRDVSALSQSFQVRCRRTGDGLSVLAQTRVL